MSNFTLAAATLRGERSFGRAVEVQECHRRGHFTYVYRFGFSRENQIHDPQQRETQSEPNHQRSERETKEEREEAVRGPLPAALSFCCFYSEQ